MSTDHTVQPVCTAVEALGRLKAGNLRFMNGQARFPTVQKEVLADLAKGQQPYVTILGCSDSRVPPELVFDAGFGAYCHAASQGFQFRKRETHAPPAFLPRLFASGVNGPNKSG